MADERFNKVQEQYAALRAQLDAGSITYEQFEAALRPLMFQDSQGRYWMIGVESGKWHMYDGQKWTQTDPPVSAPAPVPSAPLPTPAPAAPSVPQRLVVMRGSANVASIDLGNESITIGRATSNMLVLNDLQASRQHARLDFDNGTWAVKDLNSRNGTFVNGRRVTQQVVHPGDQIAIGDTLISVQA